MVDSPSHVPYQPYKPKRHSRNLSNQFLVPVPGANAVVDGGGSPPPASRPNGPAGIVSAPVVPQLPQLHLDAEKVLHPISSLFSSLSGSTGTSPRPASVFDAFRPRHSPAPSISISETTPSLPTSPVRATHHHHKEEAIPVTAAATTTIESEKARTSDEIRPTPVVAEIVTIKPPTPEDETQQPQLPLTPPPEADPKALPPPPQSPESAPEEPSPSLPSPAPSVPDKPPPSPTSSQKATDKQALPHALSEASAPASPSRRTSTFRRLAPTPSGRSPLPSSPLRPASTLPSSTLHPPTLGSHARVASASSLRHFDQPLRPAQPRSRLTSSSSVASSLAPSPSATLTSPAGPSTAPTPRSRPQSAEIHAPPPRTVSLHPSASTSASPSSASPSTLSPSPSPAPLPASRPAQAPYRPGFQPKGVYRPLTDEFLEARKRARDAGRIERTRLERRLEKLIALHFPPSSSTASSSSPSNKTSALHPHGKDRPTAQTRRASSFFDVDLSDLRGLVQTDKARARDHVRAAEQRIAPWEPDASAAACPLCAAPFHPLSNRRHHCRLCGRVVCALPPRAPQRPVACSSLFVVSDQSGAGGGGAGGRIEEVGEGVDYGVRRRTVGVAAAGGAGGMSEEEKFLKGVRVCRECRPAVLRQQYRQEMREVPPLARLYDAFVALEKEIEEDLPVFQELVLDLSHNDQPSKEASAARKRLLDAFARYDALAKRIRALRPAQGGAASAQGRMQAAILARANMFLQKHMFPLQSLPKAQQRQTASGAASPSTPAVAVAVPGLDPDSELALRLQPLLEQEALLEGYVEEAKTHRKFEDAKTLKRSLDEIRLEIDRMLAGATTGK
ncbi:hypothetical protein PUNSTDRAFT_144973 [Punctularia strigosozonata HHB-11173 SS5]|uniref:uncharacterized protein n=1 Tax=Punctularia strigosozonata (strain HHB-11173) TaxID=741275 RepID=UPI00044164EE|nr:uncharacterized protein PUNSTDRAFT_144973 [Punctularia strigosozonata HHB-11173 SS5]EIN07506.1 hypothetical protein PUNSTDRAFT_144973 [Punctularia strigosozonata HHB-11173 SS5]